MIAIIGGSGFIGTRLCKLIARCNRPFIIVDKANSITFPERVILADVRSLAELSDALGGVNVLINLAAEHKDDVRPLSLYDEVNVQGAKNLCTVSREKNINTIIFTSSVAVYGFAPIGTDESGQIAPFNDYGRTKYEAEQIYEAWQAEDPSNRTLVIVRPTVVFGEQNRGNVYNLLRQIASDSFVMIGKGKNLKSIAYVENIAAFLKFAISLQPGIHVYNYIDKPDFTMNELISTVHRILGKHEEVGFRLPYVIGLMIGKGFDIISAITGKRLAISSIRVKKFCANTMFDSRVALSDFVAPVPLVEALERTVRHEFVELHENENVFYSE